MTKDINIGVPERIKQLKTLNIKINITFNKNKINKLWKICTKLYPTSATF